MEITLVELVERIKNGENEKIEELWNRLQRLVMWYAKKRLIISEPYMMDFFDDMIQEGYLALLRAIEGYRAPEDGGTDESFRTYYCLLLKTAFNKALYGGRTAKHLRAPLNNNYASIDEPIGEDTDTTLGETLLDPNAESFIYAIEDIDLRAKTREAIKESLGVLCGLEYEIINAMFEKDASYVQACRLLEMTPEQKDIYRGAFNRGKKKMIHHLNKHKREKGIEEFITLSGGIVLSNGEKKQKHFYRSTTESAAISHMEYLDGRKRTQDIFTSR